MPSPAHGGGLGWGLGGQRLLDLGEQAIEFDGLGVEIVAAGGERLLAIAGHLPPRVPTSRARRGSPASAGADPPTTRTWPGAPATRNCETISIRRSRSIGLVRYPAAPNAMPRP